MNISQILGTFSAIFMLYVVIYSLKLSLLPSKYNQKAVNERPRLVFSYTTIAKRAHLAEGTVQSLLNQTVLPDAIYLHVPTKVPWKKLPEEIRNDASLRKPENQDEMVPFPMPKWIDAPEYRGLLTVIQHDDDLGPAMKILGMLGVEHEKDPETIILYGDDDREYASDMVAKVLSQAKHLPYAVFGRSGSMVLLEGILGDTKRIKSNNRVNLLEAFGGIAMRRWMLSPTGTPVHTYTSARAPHTYTHPTIYKHY
eukprot:GDKI01030384.1.p1 GENE.GDKI01030384.1~~GDKI01030384.1.p1  ORF type:complete len:290 (-),score=22.07 GDKI01030384.1:5-766(-)